ncbi:MAG TPA: STAS domain-containing protein [Candidatus Limnocylindrales bacterium]
MTPSEPVPAHAALRAPASGVVDVDVASLTSCDLGTVDRLARCALAARRQGLRIRLVGASPELAELVALSGLTRVIPAAPERDRDDDPRDEGSG